MDNIDRSERLSTDVTKRSLPMLAVQHISRTVWLYRSWDSSVTVETW